jgi:hypothetical protein
MIEVSGADDHRRIDGAIDVRINSVRCPRCDGHGLGSGDVGLAGRCASK